MEDSEVTEATQAETEEARSPHRADRAATPEEEEEAVGDRTVDADVRAHEKDMAQRGANEKGEGRLP